MRSYHSCCRLRCFAVLLCSSFSHLAADFFFCCCFFPPLAFYSPALYFSSTSQAWFTISIQNHTCSVQLRLKSCCLHLRSSAAVQWQLTLTIQSDKLKMMSQSQFKATVHRKKSWKHIFFFVLCLLVWLHHNTHSPRTAVSLVLLLRADLGSVPKLSNESDTTDSSLFRCWLCCKSNYWAQNDPKHISAVTEQTWASQMQTVCSNEQTLITC